MMMIMMQRIYHLNEYAHKYTHAGMCMVTLYFSHRATNCPRIVLPGLYVRFRFYSKFHQRRMQDLTETGLHNLTCLFLVLALCVDPEEVVCLTLPKFSGYKLSYIQR